MTPVAEALAAWAAGLEPSDDDLALARRSLVDTVAVAVAGAGAPDRRPARRAVRGRGVGACSRTSSTSTTCTSSRRRTSAPCACPRCWRPAATRAPTWPARASWRGWAPRWAGRTTRRAGTRPARRGPRARRRALRSPSASAPTRWRRRWRSRCRRPAACSARSAPRPRRCRSGPRRRPGVRAARLAAAGASADPRALDQWLALVGGDADRLALDGPAVPGGLAVKLFPCCYALQRPIAALRALDVRPRAGRARGGAHAAERARPAHPRRADDRPGGQVQPAVRGRGHPARRPARDRELHRRRRRPPRGAGAPGAASRSTPRPAATGCWPATSRSS